MAANTKTFLQVQTRVLNLEGHQRDNSADLLAAVKLDINTVYSDVATIDDWYWLEQTITATATGDTITLPSNVNSVNSIIEPDGETIVEERERIGQIEMKRRIEQRGRVKTYALDGVDTSGNLVLNFTPSPSSGNYSIRVSIEPPELVADTDVPLGPPEMFTYLVWKTRYLRLLDDEERPSLIQQVERRYALVFDQMKRQNNKVLRRLRRFHPLPMNNR